MGLKFFNKLLFLVCIDKLRMVKGLWIIEVMCWMVVVLLVLVLLINRVGLLSVNEIVICLRRIKEGLVNVKGWVFEEVLWWFFLGVFMFMIICFMWSCWEVGLILKFGFWLFSVMNWFLFMFNLCVMMLIICFCFFWDIFFVFRDVIKMLIFFRKILFCKIELVNIELDCFNVIREVEDGRLCFIFVYYFLRLCRLMFFVLICLESLLKGWSLC